MRCFRPLATLCALAATLTGPLAARAASVLTHESMVDAAWDVKLKSVLLSRYPKATAEELKTAHAFAYGGSILQDLGYYPHGSEQFSDMAHYVRTGIFIKNLVQESQNLNELAFALGALSHYVVDAYVHRNATNIAEPKLYPKMEKKFGPVVTYEDDPIDHLKTEFGFDVLEVARGNFAPQAYHDFIGFNVAPQVLQRAFEKTYNLPLSDYFPNLDNSIGSYRHDISQLIPKATRIAWTERKKEIQKAAPGMTRRRFVYVMRRSSYERDWGKQYDRPTTQDKFLAFLLKLVPPIGPLRALHLKLPTPQVEKLFMAAFTDSLKRFESDVNIANDKSLELGNINYDVGVETHPGEYRLQDDTYAVWVHKLAARNFAGVTSEVRANILAYYHNPNAPIHTKQDSVKWNQLLSELNTLKTTAVASNTVQ